MQLRKLQKKGEDKGGRKRAKNWTKFAIWEQLKDRREKKSLPGIFPILLRKCIVDSNPILWQWHSPSLPPSHRLEGWVRQWGKTKQQAGTCKDYALIMWKLDTATRATAACSLPTSTELLPECVWRHTVWLAIMCISSPFLNLRNQTFVLTGTLSTCSALTHVPVWGKVCF